MNKLLFVQFSEGGRPGALAEIATEQCVPFDIAELATGMPFPDARNYGAVVSFGSNDSANDDTDRVKQRLEAVAATLDAEVPYLGMCFGLQLAVKARGGRVTTSPVAEYGFYDSDGNPFQVSLTDAGKSDPLFDGLPPTFNVFEAHSETVLPTDTMTVLGIGSHGVNQAVKVSEVAYGLQPHIELNPTMFREWSVEPELAPIGAETLLAQAASPEIQYPNVSRVIFTNFLRIAEVL